MFQRYIHFICAAISLNCTTLTANENGDLEPFLFESSKDADFYFSPTRLGQLKRDIPGSLTILYRDDILARGIYSIPEAMRLVPGMSVLESTSVSQATGHDYKISYHGGESFSPRRIQVQIDGMSVYLGSLSKIDWFQLPVTVYDIERIEVMRNPSAASYGANAFQASINIITRHSKDVALNEFEGSVGSQKNSFISLLSSSNYENSSFYVQASRLGDRGFDNISAYEGSSSASPWIDDDGRDSAVVYRFVGRADVDLSSSTSLSSTVAHVASKYQAGYVFANQKPDTYADIKSNDTYINTQLKIDHEDSSISTLRASFKNSNLKQDFFPCSPLLVLFPETNELFKSNPEYFNALLKGQTPSGESPQDDALLTSLLYKIGTVGQENSFATVCGKTNQSYTDNRSQIAFDHSSFFNDSIRFIAGGSFDYVTGKSQTYLGGTESMSMFSIMTSIEWKPQAEFTYNFGSLVEYADNINESFFSPRVSLNWNPTDSVTYRVVLNKSYRTPDLAETDRDWSYSVTNIQPVINQIDEGVYAISADSSDFDLTAEEILAGEIGMLYHRDAKSSINLRFFMEKLDNLISEKPYITNFKLSNSGSGKIKGFECDGNYYLLHDLNFEFGYSYQDHDFNTLNEYGMYARHSGNAALSYFIDNNRLTIGYLGNSQMSGESFDRWSFTWQKRLIVNTTSILATVNLNYQPSNIGYTDMVFGLKNRFEYDHLIYGGMSLSMDF